MLTFQRTADDHAAQDTDPPAAAAAARPQSADAEELAALLQRIGLGDRDALRALYSRCAPKLFGLALRILVRKDWAEDVLQESFVNIWRHAGDYRPHMAAPMTWMTTIVRNRALDCLRRQHAERVQESVPLDDTYADVLADHAPGPADLALAGQQARALAECLKRLDPKQREVISLAYLRDLSHSELAQALSLPLGTVKSWMRRGLDRLRECLGAP
ncbi:RNA polymerase sigma factor [Ralstonia mojiangensis]|uniref:RNA polymerase sigma factor n=1 Tax=Ralstonia mojiangensis TaxID=2953895 RepID=UPI0021B20A87|nr:sigma-70 family RNA polymerase sigma factor [Ralstonia mojiangensis]MCT7324993.1 sigma-70 family RNA polymerase sigma factor [Ralstonia mojiangensis]